MESWLTSVLSKPDFELRFRSLTLAGHGFAFPCDAEGHVPVSNLSDLMRNNYFYACAVVGNELTWPVVVRCAPDEACGNAEHYPDS